MAITKESLRGARSKRTLAKAVKKKVAIIGAGWYGLKSADVFKRSGLYDVVVFEKGKDLASGTSGYCSGRTHKLPTHYLRSKATQEDCHRDFATFSERNPKVLVANDRAVHGLVHTDAHGNDSKATLEQFQTLYKTEPSVRDLSQSESGISGFQDAVVSSEPSILTGLPLKEELRESLVAADIPFFCDYPISNVRKEQDMFTLRGPDGEHQFDEVVNATGFQAFVPEDFNDNPLGIAAIYQPCLGLLYEDTVPGSEPFSFLAVDGANPSIVPLGENRYMLTHGTHTLLASCHTPEQARLALSKVTDNFVSDVVKQRTEDDLRRYYPDFFKRYKFLGWRAEVLAKPLTDTEFRAGFAFKDSSGIIQTFPGKIINSERVAKETLELAEGIGIINRGGYSYTEDGGLARGIAEISKQPTGAQKHYTGRTNPYPHLLQSGEDESCSSTFNSSSFWKKDSAPIHRRLRSNSEEFRDYFSKAQL
ncbi:MAG: FAD-dependent oxidoreductase [Legionellaceae bacterium]|nr:FAD-dependent oxidoreductase [Legionellaceae bacterium]